MRFVGAAFARMRGLTGGGSRSATRQKTGVRRAPPRIRFAWRASGRVRRLGAERSLPGVAACLHDYALAVYSHARHAHNRGPEHSGHSDDPGGAAGERPRAPVSATAGSVVAAVPGRRPVPLPRGGHDGSASPDGPRIRVAIVGATGYVGAELVRLLSRHPNVQIEGLVGRGRTREPIGGTHIHLDRTGLHVDATVPDADAIFLALPHR